MSRNWHDRLGLFLIVALFLIEVPRYQSTLPDHNPIVALGMGLLLSGGAFYCVETWGMLKRRGGRAPKRTNWLAWMIIVQIVLAPAIMTPALVAQERGLKTSELLPDKYLWLWMVAVTFAPVAIGGMVAFARSLQYSKADLEAKAEKPKVSKADLKPPTEPIEVAMEPCVFCDEPFKNAQARGAHQAWCDKNPNKREKANGATGKQGERENV